MHDKIANVHINIGKNLNFRHLQKYTLLIHHPLNQFIAKVQHKALI